MDTQVKPQRIRQLLVLGLVLIAVITLAAGLPSLIVDEGRDVVTENPLAEDVERGGDAIGPIGDLPAQLVSVATALLIAGSLFLVIRYKQYRQIFRYVVGALIISAFIYLFFNSREIVLEPPPAQEMAVGEAPESDPEIVAAPDFVTEPASWITLAISFGIGVVAVAIGIVIYRRWQRPSPELEPLPLLVKDAEITLNEIRAGADLKDAVTRCYLNMSRSVRMNSGISRNEGMTPREFATALYGLGLPQSSVDRLTRLFEKVRYGSHEATQREKLEAVACMEEIIAAVKAPNARVQARRTQSTPAPTG